MRCMYPYLSNVHTTLYKSMIVPIEQKRGIGEFVYPEKYGRRGRGADDGDERRGAGEQNRQLKSA